MTYRRQQYRKTGKPYRKTGHQSLNIDAVKREVERLGIFKPHTPEKATHTKPQSGQKPC